MSPDVSEEAARKNLAKIDHVIVLMMENRSFDHVLGYLKLDGVRPQVDGLEADMGNEDAAGTFHKVRPLGRRKIDLKALDPGHGPADVREQIAGGTMAGFLKNYVKAFERNSEDNPPPAGFRFDPTLVLAYLRADDVPVYDYLARSFQVCDRWFSSVPGPTWPNRLYAAAGQSGGTTANRRPPIYDLATFVRKLDADDVSWRWYSHDPGTLRGIDGRYRLGHDDEFAYFARKTLFERRSFLDDARDGRLPAVSWIDPNFVDFRLFGPPGSNDDHPPSPMMAGQELVLTLIESVMRSPAWKKSLIVITYDEHGGFYDHVDPGQFTAADDRRLMRRYGVRVPALVVSPYVERGVSHAVYDHTSIIKTILLRFCKRPDTVAKSMGARVAAANHLGSLLTRAANRPRGRASNQQLTALVEQVAAWRRATYRTTTLGEAAAPAEAAAAGPELTDLQEEVVAMAKRLRAAGLQPGEP
ncbi:MAG TPA: alkaline phosphatase family protein [Gaiellaceae bacterium]|nr:alkaline phosphatase family protein [Gaiellaceae bacterium]